MKTYSTRQVAQELGISWPTLNRYIRDKKIPMPPVTELGSARVRVWSEEDIRKVREILPKIENGRKTRYQKQSAVRTKQSVKAKKRKAGK